AARAASSPGDTPPRAGSPSRLTCRNTCSGGRSVCCTASAKVDATASLLAASAAGSELPPPRWHFVGQLQTRKARSVARYAYAVHSLDRPELATRLADAVEQAERGPLQVFLQVSLDGDPARGGVSPGELAALAAAVTARKQLSLRGVMAVAPLGADPGAAFEQLASLSRTLRAEHPQADAISAGMSDDLEEAVRHGATHLRVGSALLGRRSPVFG
ncbi:MAG: dependent protein, partial [Pseudonocardiales bacterium]|nr:dependent protein [Pseudonocardiales bacterium]